LKNVYLWQQTLIQVRQPMRTEKIKKIFVCKECGTTASKWEGKCSSCGEWNSLVEEIVAKSPKQVTGALSALSGKSKVSPKRLSEIETGKTARIECTDSELNRVLGGGIVPGSVVLIGGHPGIGKSTLLLQIALDQRLKVLYVSGEESDEQIKMRVDRLGKANDQCYLLCDTNLELIIQVCDELQPDVLIIDSIQTISHPLLDSTPGSISQIRECTGELQRYAKTRNTPIFIIGHINKEGDIAGPKLLEHIVDTVLQFEGDSNYVYRILRTKKNRFGSADELGIYEMRSDGLREVANPSELLIAQKDADLSGCAIGATIEGTRPMLIETQALVSSAVYSTSQRSATGFDLRRLSMLLAVLEKRAGIYFIQKDVFLNLAGGIRVDDPALDLAVVAALISSLEDQAISPRWCFAGEIGLSGEVRPVNRIEQRIQEASRLGFEKIFLSRYNLKGLNLKGFKIEIADITKVTDLVRGLT
jgi:DNA repair protein RadA/Sms